MEYFEQLYTYKFDNLQEIEQSFENHKLPSLNLSSP